MANEPIQGGPYPEPIDPPDGPGQMSAIVGWAAGRSVMRFASLAARDAALPTPVDGMVCYIAADNAYYGRVGGEWLVLWSDTGWMNATPAAGVTGTFQVRRVGTVVTARWSCTSSLASDAVANPLFTIPTGYRPTGLSAPASFFGAGARALVGEVGIDGGVTVRNVHSGALANHRGSATYLI